MAALNASFVRGEAASLEVADEIADAVRQISRAYGSLRQRVIEFDHELFGSRILSIGELGLRTQGFILAMSMQCVRSEMASARDGATYERTMRLTLGDSFASFDELTAYLAKNLQRITAVWQPLRQAVVSRSSSSTLDGDEKALCLAAVQAAQQEMIALNDGGFGDFLRRGVQCRAWPTLQRACVRMRVAIQKHPATELELAALGTAAATWRVGAGRAQT
jgi:hypothetical protein